MSRDVGQAALNAPSIHPALVSLLWLAIAAVAHAGDHDQRVTPVPTEPGHFMDTGLPPVPPEDIEKFRDFVGDVVLSERGVRSIREVSVLATVRGDLTLHLPELTPEYAQALSRHRGSLTVHGPVVLPEKSAELLGQHQGAIALPDCRVASAAAVQALCTGNKQALSLGIEAISEDVARALVMYEGTLKFPNVTRFDDRVATILSAHKGMLTLHCLESVTPSVASDLADKAGGWQARLGSPDVPLPLTVEAASNLARSPSRMEFQISNITRAPHDSLVLDALSRRRCGGSILVFLKGAAWMIRALEEPGGSSDIAAPPLHQGGDVSPKGDLRVMRPTSFTPALASAMVSRGWGRLELLVTGLTEPVARVLARHDGPLDLPITDDVKPDDAAIEALFRRRASIGIPAFWMTMATVDTVLKHRGGLSVFPGSPTSFSFGVVHGKVIGIPHWKWMPPDVFERLVEYDGPLHLEGDVPVEMTSKLPFHRGPLALATLPQREAAEPLLKCKGPLFFTRECNVASIEAAKVFASEANRTTVCTSEHLIWPDAEQIAAIIAQRRGEISFPRLRYISAKALRTLSQKEDVCLPPLEDLYILDEQARDVVPNHVVSERFAAANSERQPPPQMPSWHSWERQLGEANRQ